jgi:hypothetical protein
MMRFPFFHVYFLQSTRAGNGPDTHVKPWSVIPVCDCGSVSFLFKHDDRVGHFCALSVG